MALPADGVLDEIRSRVDIVDIVSPYTTLKKSGASYRGPCPIHKGTNPSFSVLPDRWSFNCFSCGEKGDGFSFLQKMEGITFSEAKAQLAARAGVELAEFRPDPQAIEAEGRLRKIVEESADFFVKALNRSAEARGYLEGRAILPETIDRFGLGYGPDSSHALIDHLVSIGYQRPEIVEAGMAAQRDDGSIYDRFRHRIIIPIRSAKGQVIGFGGRALRAEERAKYLNSPETPLFHKGNTLFGLDMAGGGIREQDAVVIVEGYFDVIRAHQAGYTNVVAPLGTALTERQVKILTRMTKRIILALDSDSAGQAATLRGLETVQQAADEKIVALPTWQGYVRYVGQSDVDLRVLSISDGKDPDDFIRDHPGQWPALVDAAVPVVDHLFRSVLAGVDHDDPASKAKAVETLRPAIDALGDPVQQSHYVNKLAEALGIDERAIRSQALPQPRRWREEPVRENVPIVLIPERKAEHKVLAELLRHPSIDPAAVDLEVDLFSGPGERAIFAARAANQPVEDSTLAALLDRIRQTSQPETDLRTAERGLRQAAKQLRLAHQRRLILGGGAAAEDPEELASAVDEASRLVAVMKARQQRGDE